MVPKGWEVKQLANLTTKISDGIHSTPTYVEKSDIYFINGNNLKNGSIVVSDGTKKVCPENAQNHRRDLSNRTILMSINGTIGNLAFYNNENVVLGKSACYINVTNNVDIKYIYYTLNSSKTQNFYTTELTGSTIKNLSLKTIKSTKILTPPLPEQQKIANILSTWDKAISTTERLIENSTQQKKALMQQLLTGKKRLLDESGKRFEGEWEEIELGDICSRVMEKNNGQSTNVVTISAQQGLIRQEEFFKKSVASEILDNYYVLRKGQFAYNKSYSNGYPMGAIKRLNRYEDGVVTTLYICFEIKDHSKTDTDFLEQYFDSGLLNRGLTKVAAEGGRAHGLLNVKPSDFMALKFKFPTYPEQQKIATVLTNADKEIELLEQQLADLQQEKKALMQVLLTGKKRVVVDENV